MNKKNKENKTISDDVNTKENAEEKAYRLITDSLVRTHKPGDYLYESKLAEELGMSRTPVAIAMNTLVSEGLLRKIPKKGCIIPKLSIEDANEVFMVRRTLEMEAIRAIMSKKDPAVFEKMQENIDLQISAVRTGSFDRYYPIDLDFHRLLVNSAQNKYLLTAWNRVFIRCNIYTGYFMDVFREHQLISQNLLNDHIEIFDAIKRNSLDLALSRMFSHFDNIAMYAIEHTMIYDIHG